MLTRAAFREAEVAAALELQTIEKVVRKAECEIAVGASGTISALAAMIRENGWGDRITLRGLLEEGSDDTDRRS